MNGITDEELVELITEMVKKVTNKRVLLIIYSILKEAI